MPTFPQLAGSRSPVALKNSRSSLVKILNSSTKAPLNSPWLRVILTSMASVATKSSGPAWEAAEPQVMRSPGGEHHRPFFGLVRITFQFKELYHDDILYHAQHRSAHLSLDSCELSNKG